MSNVLAPPSATKPKAGERSSLSDTAPPAERLFRSPQQFDFFQAVRLLEQLQPQRRAVGTHAPPEDEIVHFKAALGSVFPASSIAELTPCDAGEAPARPPEMTVAFLGLTGPSGALPAHYTDLLWRLQRDVRGPEKQAVRAWFDLFNHRLTSLFYRSWEKYRPLVAYQRGEYQNSSPDTFSQGLLSFGGLTATAHSAGSHHSPAYRLPRALVRYAGLLAQRPRNVANLKTILCDYFAMPMEIIQFQGEWVALAPDQQMQLGICGTLATDATVGPRVWNRQGKIRIRIGPLSLAAFEQLLPGHDGTEDGGPHLGEIGAAARFYLGPEIDFDVQLVLRAEDVPPCCLSGAAGPRLGWNTWLAGDTKCDRLDAVFTTGQ